MSQPNPKESVRLVRQDGECGKTEGQLHGSLNGRMFPSQCPPLVTRDTIIIAVCGPNDYRNNAHPDQDGRFFSDFYLFHHLFRGTARKQYWMTCVHPEVLVSKYGQYVHGNPNGSDPRVVLDATFKDNLKDILVFDPEDLLEKFTSCVANASKEVEGTNSPILTLMFAHGNLESSSLTIGGAETYETCHKLTRNAFCEALLRHNPSPNVAFLTAMQYGGGWAQSTFSTMTGVDDDMDLSSWPASRSINRCCDSRYAKTVTDALIRNEISELNWEEEGYKIFRSETYTLLVDIICKILTKDMDSRERNQISFSAKDDLWGMECREMTGFSLSAYQEKWDALKPLSQMDKSPAVSIRFSDSITLSLPEARHRIQRLALDYMSSNPGDDSAAKNHAVHGDCGRLLAGKPLETYELENLAGSLQYRLLTIMDTATEYKDYLRLDFTDCRDVDVSKYKVIVVKDQHKGDKFDAIYKMFAAFGDLFDRPVKHEGMPYDKGAMYLILALTNSDWDQERIKLALDTLTKLKSGRSTIQITMRHFGFQEEPKIREMLGAIANSREERPRSLSPVDSTDEDR